MTTNLNQVLLVDDSPSDIQFLIENLKDEFVLSVAKSGEKAIQLAENQPSPAVILMDVSMPGIDGYETCRKIKESPSTEGIEIIFVSAHDTTEEKLKGYDAGGSDYIIKPVQPAELKKKLRVALKTIEAKNNFQLETKSAIDTAMTAIMDVGELGSVVDFLRRSFSTTSLRELASLLINTTDSLNLTSSVQIRAPNETINMSSSGNIPPLEIELMSRLSESVRIHQMGKRLILNFGYISQIIKNLPDDEDKVGRLRDHLALIMEGANDKCRSLILSDEMRNLLIDSNETMDDIHQMQTRLKHETMEVIDNLMGDVQKSFLSYGLTEDQEELLLTVIKNAVDICMDNFERGMQIDEAMQLLIGRIRQSTLFDDKNKLN